MYARCGGRVKRHGNRPAACVSNVLVHNSGFAPNLPEQMAMDCRPRCGACCIAPSISSPIPGMPHGKPAGVRCVQLDADDRCRIFGRPDRPAVCASLRPEPDMCGASAAHAMRFLTRLEAATAAP
ncbi:NhaC [Ralstonia solanacearum Po82]|uniref:NhaC n=1 Tax=Ralstonia solanacearum (strain Po82) TaxID=1031711 RepID=F6G3R5_RALS8|nr:NhaC [Ralstonia solanacearum Po82]